MLSRQINEIHHESAYDNYIIMFTHVCTEKSVQS